jgi:hypothetical protein
MPERRTINIPKSDFDILKKYCDENALDMPKWMVKLAIDKWKESNPKPFNFFGGHVESNGNKIIDESRYVDIKVLCDIRDKFGLEEMDKALDEMLEKTCIVKK